MGLPQGAIEQKMRADGLDPKQIFGDLATSGRRQRAAAKPGGLAKGKAPAARGRRRRRATGGDLMAQIKGGDAETGEATV